MNLSNNKIKLEEIHKTIDNSLRVKSNNKFIDILGSIGNTPMVELVNITKNK
jgi:hypothetical protein